MAVMVKYTTAIKKLFHEGITKAKDNGILPETFKKCIIPLGQFIILFIIILYYYSL